HFSTLLCLYQRLAAHVAEHQHGAAAPVLDHHGQQSAAFAPVEFVRIDQNVSHDHSPGGPVKLSAKPSWPDRNALRAQISLQVADPDCARVKHARRQCTVDIRLREYLEKVMRRT